MKHTVSAIIPAFNEKKTIRQVVQTCLDSDFLSEVICVNDGSIDGTLEILKSFGNKITLIDFKKNMGKGSAMAEAIKKSRGDILIFIDADLVGLKPEHIELFYKTFVDKRLDALIVSLDVPEVFFKFTSAIALSPYEKGKDSITGERIYYKKDLLPHVKKIAPLGYGVEVYLNNIYKNKELGFLKLSGVTQLLKHHKKGWSQETIDEYLKEFREIAKVLAEQRVVSKIRRYKKPLVKFRKKLKTLSSGRQQRSSSKNLFGMRKIEKKAIPELFEKVLSGEKTFDARLNRFICKPGDILVLREWDPKKKKYTGRVVEKKITFILKTKDLEKFWTKDEVKKYGFQIIAFKN